MVKMPLGLRDKDLLKTAVDFFAKTLPLVLVMANPYLCGLLLLLEIVTET